MNLRSTRIISHPNGCPATGYWIDRDVYTQRYCIIWVITVRRASEFGQKVYQLHLSYVAFIRVITVRRASEFGQKVYQLHLSYVAFIAEVSELCQ